MLNYLSKLLSTLIIIIAVTAQLLVEILAAVTKCISLSDCSECMFFFSLCGQWGEVSPAQRKQASLSLIIGFKNALLDNYILKCFLNIRIRNVGTTFSCLHIYSGSHI